MFSYIHVCNTQTTFHIWKNPQIFTLLNIRVPQISIKQNKTPLINDHINIGHYYFRKTIFNLSWSCKKDLLRMRKLKSINWKNCCFYCARSASFFSCIYFNRKIKTGNRLPLLKKNGKQSCGNLISIVYGWIICESEMGWLFFGIHFLQF